MLSIGRIKQLTGGFCETRNPTFPYSSIIFFHLPWTAHFPQSSSVFSSTRGGAGGGFRAARPLAVPMSLLPPPLPLSTGGAFGARLWVGSAAVSDLLLEPPIELCRGHGGWSGSRIFGVASPVPTVAEDSPTTVKLIHS